MTGAQVRRGLMAGDQFTQIANGLFRDSHLTCKAKGIFGYISTHRAGWHVSVAGLVRAGPDGRDAVRTGLQELETHGYLVRERLRRPDGTLGETVYCITDHPACVEAFLADAAAALPAPGAPIGGRCDDGMGIRRGVMAGDQFTQIANSLFRDRQLSFKAKGLFGLISTHRDGWHMTVADLARCGRDGVSAVTTGLEDLERHGFLQRDRDRNPDGTLGSVTYFITDLPSLHNTRSQPESGNPGLDIPTLADRPTKNTISKKTNKQNTSPLPPCATGDAARAPGWTDQTNALPADDVHPGIRLLLAIGASRPELLLTGKPLTDQGRVVTVMMDAGWSPAQLRHVLTDRPLPHPVRTTVGAIIAARLRAAQAYPPPATAADHHEASPDGPFVSTAGSSSTAATARSVSAALTYRALVECAGCGRPGTAPGEDLCPACLHWPPCRTCPGPTPRRAQPGGDGRCTTCASTFTNRLEGSSP
ncbi:hypothetical protein [Streptomyces pseudovenezuelae]|uniref:DNA-binding protein n=1 Tax=Streptomyces pseudovenezuelae TaxID=67350 RepID=A0ABT6M4G4_9ACTN|nr:hypothetical protein [Streptomyces pseudovenezuelae]MDH6222881.1 hypothetical protein [Streptomyces pseudovenezuelae]